MSCKPKHIMRDGYVRGAHERKSYVRKDGIKVKASSVKKTIVPPTCIKSVTGSSTKGIKLFDLKKHELGKFGYHGVKKLSSIQRHKALNKALKKMERLSLFRKLVALSTLFKRTDPKMHDIFRADAEWVKTH